MGQDTFDFGIQSRSARFEALLPQSANKSSRLFPGRMSSLSALSLEAMLQERIVGRKGTMRNADRVIMFKRLIVSHHYLMLTLGCLTQGRMN